MVSWVTIQQNKSWCKVRPGNRGKCIKESNDHACNNVQLLQLLLHIRTFPNGISGFQSWSSLDSVSDKVCSKCCTPFVLTCVCWSVDADFCFRAWQYLNHLQKSVFTTEEMSLIDNKKTLKMSQTPYKGQLISKCPCCVKTSSKTTTKFFPGFLP